jgi:hypothetical protein
MFVSGMRTKVRGTSTWERHTYKDKRQSERHIRTNVERDTYKHKRQGRKHLRERHAYTCIHTHTHHRKDNLSKSDEFVY